MPRKPVRSWANAGPRRGNGAATGLTDSRSLSPRSRGRLTPPLPEPPRASPYKPALVFALTYCVGHSVSIQTRNGDLFEGILHTPGLVQSEVHFVLRKARKMKQEGWEKDLVERLVIPSAEVVQLHAKDLPIHPDPPPRPSSSPVLAFHPIHGDTEPVFQFGDFDDVRDIGFLGDKDRERTGAGLFGRELKKWEPEEGGGVMLEFDDVKHEVGTWDQFAENEKKFGVTTNFNMDLYTTPLPANSRYTVAQAEKLARQIQSASSPNLHLQDERNQLALDDSGVSDEQLYSSVLTDHIDQKSEPNGASPKKSEMSDRSGMDEKAEPPKAQEEKKSTPITLILPQKHTRPMIIASRQQQPKLDTRSEFNRVARELASVKAIPHGSPLEQSNLVHDFESLNALSLTTVRQTVKPEVREQFRQYKESQRQKQEAARTASREGPLSKFRPFSKEGSPLAKTPLKSEEGSPHRQPFFQQQSALTLAQEQGFGSMVLKDDEPVTSEDISDETSPDVKTQLSLRPLKTERDPAEEDDLGDENSGRRLNPNATPFNPGQVRQSIPGSTAAPTEESASDVSLPGTESPRPVSASPTREVVQPFVPEELEEFTLQPPPMMPEPVMPPVPQAPQPTMLIRPQPPPPPPRVVTPPPPPQQPPAMQEIHQAPMMVQMVRPPHRPSRQSASPGGRRTPHNHMHPEPPAQMILNNPAMMPVPPQSGPPSQPSGPPHPPNAQPPNMQPHPMPHASGAMHMLPQQMAHYPYMPDMAGRVPIVYPYPPPMAPAPGPPPPGQQNVPTSDQPMHHPHVVYPFYPAMASYPVPSYGPPMMQPGMHPGYVSMAPPPMTTQQRPGSGPRPRGAQRRKPGSFFNGGPRRG